MPGFSDIRVWITPAAGLCNRLRAIWSSQALAEAHGASLGIVWERHPDCNADIRRLLEFDFPVAKWIQRSASNDWHPGWRWYRRRCVCQGFTLLTNRPVTQLVRAGTEENPYQKSQPYFDDLMESVPGVWIKSLRFFYPVPDQGPFPFRPVSALQARVNALGVQDAVGVHIRRGDNEKAIRSSPVEAFEARMAMMANENPDVRFFLATDDSGVEALLCERFPGRVQVYRKRSLNRDDPVAIEDAVVDLFALGSCGHLLASSESTFSLTAARIGGMPVEVVRGG